MICKNWNKWSLIVLTLALAVSMCVLLHAPGAYAATYYSRSTGDWTANTTWSKTSGGGAVGAGVYPVTGDVVIIERGYTVTVDADAACTSITIRNTNDGNSTLTLSGTINTSAKTFATTPPVNSVLSLEGTATVTVTTGAVTYGANATLPYNTSTARTVSSEELIATSAATGGVIIANTGTITLNTNKDKSKIRNDIVHTKFDVMRLNSES